MNYFLNLNKSMITFTLILLIGIPILGINFFISFVSNILLLLFLILLLFLLVLFISFNSYKSNINTCSNCGAISFGVSNTCMNCGEEIKSIDKNDDLDNKPSESTIEIKAEEIK